MDNEKIKALVQSYVDELFAHDDMSDQDSIEAKNDAFVMCMAFAGHILETHCVVEKSAIEKLDIAYRAKEYNLVVLNQDDVEMLFGKDDLIGKEEKE